MVIYVQINDLVIIKDDVHQIIYIIKEINDDNVLLKGYNHRTFVIKKIHQIEKATTEQISNEENVVNKYKTKIRKITNTRNMGKPLFGRILHIDGDEDYLESCMKLYKEMGIYAEGLNISENKIKDKIIDIIEKTTPDIIVITGHDIYNGKDKKDLRNYENTSFFIDAVRLIRKKYYYDDVVIIAGACCSHFEALIASGANFASSPGRLNIHTYDPAVIAIVVASTSINRNIDFSQCLKLIENGRLAFGGVETKGKMRMML